MPGQSLRQGPSPAFPRGPAHLLGASRRQLLKLAHQRRIGLTSLQGLISMISWSHVSSSPYLPAPPRPPHLTHTGEEVLISQMLPGLCRGCFLCQDTLGPALCRASILPLCYKEVSSPLSRRPSLRMSASLPPAPEHSPAVCPCKPDPPVVWASLLSLGPS